jgi:ParB family transcriptional regulator, chromosome partitioning protein
MKPQRKGLGKGLAALISEAEETAPAAAGAVVSEIAVDRLDPNPFQPRQVFDEAAIEELKQSILAHGVLQPVLVRPVGNRFQIIVGERRWRASRAAGRETVPAQIREQATDEEMLELAILENVQREDLNPIEVAEAIVRLQNSCHLTQDAVAQKLGVSRAHVANTIRLLKLPTRIQSALSAGQITVGHARTLLAVTDAKRQMALFERFLADGRPTVREAEELTREASGKTKKPHGTAMSAADHRQQLELAKIEERLRRALSTRVRIKPKGRGGILEIQFYTADDLERLLELLEAQ